MKKILIFLLLIVCFAEVRANIAPPQAYISEIYIDTAGNWTIEMGFVEFDSFIDSIWLTTSSGSSKIAFYELIPASDSLVFVFSSLSIITVANMVSPIDINPEGDFVRLTSYSWGDEPYDFISFGNYPGSELDCIHGTESVGYIMYDSGGSAEYWAFGIDQSPTIGVVNDTNGVMANYSGIAYDPFGNPFINGYIPLKDVGNFLLEINSDGTFSERVISRRYSFDTIKYYHSPMPTEYYTIEPVNFCLRPDSSHYQDIITTSLIIGVDEKEEPEANTVTIAPNPFSDKVDFYFNTENPGEEKDFSIYSLDGKQILQTRIADNQRKYQWQPSAEIPSGTYIYRLESKTGIIKTGKFVRL